MSKSNSDGKPIRHYQFNRSLEAKARKTFAERLGASRVELALYYLRFYGLTIRETVAYVQGTTTLHAIRQRAMRPPILVRTMGKSRMRFRTHYRTPLNRAVERA